MSFPKNKSRNITVNKVKYTWVVSPDGDGNTMVYVSVPQGGQILCTYIHMIEDDPEKGLLIITNYIVRQIIIEGLSKGWTPFENKEMMGLKQWFQYEKLDTSKATFLETTRKKMNKDAQ